jgi:hypothetical protein
VDWLVLLRQTLFYNEFTSYMVGLETAAEPMFWVVDKFSKYFGPVSVTINPVIVLGSFKPHNG